ncbi:conserved hypothetical protein [Rippkaea orientalis PCC 8801]|uniref:DUF4079 domain-containing protein n=1 Tax=Rippkaea orientalis (strain PCC 8801 / RF-1) TaxID=41431 RepID=B7JWW4_RIPO1|nr:DUF4079 domain-containing protein [Rippkaea orientalis]ACK65813.1 conserved hypothetical protein [Rippkaea orientalis PCC 8801]
MGEKLADLLEPLAAWFRTLGIPEPIVHWGHPVMMGIVVLVMGSFTAYMGWRSRFSKDGEEVSKSRASHRQLAPWVFLFIALGYTGGVLSLVMQKQPVLESPHFWTGSGVLLLLAISALTPLIGFGGEQKEGYRAFHAYLGGVVAILLIVHGVFGLQLGLSL